jgi:hydrogenase maturation protease
MADLRVIVAGVGNVLHADDGFGVAVVQALAQRSDLPSNVRILEVGIGGINLVQELMDGYDALFIVDAVERGGAPGTLYLLEPQVPDLTAESSVFEQRHAFLADMHLATPAKTLVMAKALGVIPPKVYILGCQPETCDELRVGLSPVVQAAVTRAIERLLHEIGNLKTALAGAERSL